VLVISGCSGTDDSSTSSTGSTTAASPAGIWSGTDSQSGLALIAFINSAGQATFIRADGVQYVGTAQVSGNTLDIALDGYSQFGAEFSDGTSAGVGTLSATVSAATSIEGTLSFTTSAATATSSTWSLTFNNLYDTASSPGTISGAYTEPLAAVTGGSDPMQGANITITGLGGISGQGGSSNCVLTGTVTAGNESYDLYEVSYELSECTGTYAVLNAVPFSGLAEINRGVSPAQILIGVTGKSSAGDNYSLVSALSGS
jgi:hypothetical protein